MQDERTTTADPGDEVDASVPGWHPDPAAHHDRRWWDGASWTAHVESGGVVGLDLTDGVEPPAVFGSAVLQLEEASPRNPFGIMEVRDAAGDDAGQILTDKLPEPGVASRATLRDPQGFVLLEHVVLTEGGLRTIVLGMNAEPLGELAPPGTDEFRDVVVGGVPVARLLLGLDHTDVVTPAGVVLADLTRTGDTPRTWTLRFFQPMAPALRLLVLACVFEARAVEVQRQRREMFFR